MLDLAQLREFTPCAASLRLDVLLEVHDEAELETALQVRLRTDRYQQPQTCAPSSPIWPRPSGCAKLIPADRLIVAESGIHCRADVVRLQQAGARGFLVGESLMREADIGAKLRELLG